MPTHGFAQRGCGVARLGQLSPRSRGSKLERLPLNFGGSASAGCRPGRSPHSRRVGAARLPAGSEYPAHEYEPNKCTQQAKAYTAACTPDFFLFDPDRRLAYRGQFDSSRPRNGVPVTGEDLRAAVDALLADRPVPQDQRPSVGCTIKWRPGNEPGYDG